MHHCRGSGTPGDKGCAAEVAVSCPPRHGTHLPKEVDPLPVVFSEVIAIFQEGEDVGSRKAIFAQVLFFYLMIYCLHLGKEEFTRLIYTAFCCSSLHLSIHCRFSGNLPPLALEVTHHHLPYRKISAILATHQPQPTATSTAHLMPRPGAEALNGGSHFVQGSGALFTGKVQKVHHKVESRKGLKEKKTF